MNDISTSTTHTVIRARTSFASRSLPQGLFKLARIAYLTLCNGIFLLVALEIGLRCFAGAPVEVSDGPPRGPNDVTYTLHPYLQTTTFPGPTTLPGPYLAGWQVVPSEHAHTPSRKRVMFIGGSTSQSSFPFLAQYALSERHACTSYIFAAASRCSVHSLIKFWTYVDEVEPDLVIVLDAVNDFYRGFTPPTYSLPEYRRDYSHHCGSLFPFWSQGRARFDGRGMFYAKPSGQWPEYDEHDSSLAALVDGVVSGSQLIRTLVGPVGTPHRPEPLERVATEFETLRSLPDFERNMRSLKLSCEARGVAVLFLTMPFTVDAPHVLLGPRGFFSNDGIRSLPPEEFVRGMQTFNQAVLELRDEPRSFVVDLAAEITTPESFTDEVHLTHTAQGREARLVADFILARGLLD